MAAHLQAALLQRAELERAGERQRAAGDQPVVRAAATACGRRSRGPPCRRRTRATRTRSTRARSRRGTRPSAARGRGCPAAAAANSRISGKRRRQHHRRDHRLPGDEEEHQRERVGQPALDQRVVVQRWPRPLISAPTASAHATAIAPTTAGGSRRAGGAASSAALMPRAGSGSRPGSRCGSPRTTPCRTGAA